MKLYALYTPTHETLLRDWFLPSLQDDYQLELVRCEQVGAAEQHRYGTPEFTRTTFLKIELILRAIQENWGEPFVFSDVDIQFFAKTKEQLLQLVQGRDLVIQRDSPEGRACTGFFVCRGNSKTLQLWQSVRQYMEKFQQDNDEDAFNNLFLRSAIRPIQAVLGQRAADYLLVSHSGVSAAARAFLYAQLRRRNPFQLRWGYLPEEFFSCGIFKPEVWTPGKSFPVPKNIVLHHANWTMGVENKLAQLAYVKSAVNRGALKVN